ncbi:MULTISPECIES: formylglycine-generating enzyme family protein [Methylomonas]|uniref:formylglycine-generating enzyme family protein n=1 Tax=Methylomonas TaxID=416 RepID=UPI0007C977CE|nr:formylglycine-generating enzyme family protein [Methylomonas koyamae]
MTDPARFPDPFPPPFANAWGDDRYGLWAAIEVDGGDVGIVTQMFRWIEPGTFLMGSPDDEPQRNNDEGPRHLVTISRGYWLADTACTQDLWLAVMGNNPSHFQGDLDQPVEQVSWLDVQAFLQKLQIRLSDCRVDLPSEAEWEYACRANTTTPFYFGEQISPLQVNYRGHYPYRGGQAGEFREKPLPVKSLPANPWGLYEMHGNVWECCKDEMRSYSLQPQIDPIGNDAQRGDKRRVIRGGSWNDDARWVRSAVRGFVSPSDVGLTLSFRICLRLNQAASVPAGPPGRASGASPEPRFRRADRFGALEYKPRFVLRRRDGNGRRALWDGDRPTQTGR